jgi:hypothetical protein
LLKICRSEARRPRAHVAAFSSTLHDSAIT